MLGLPDGFHYEEEKTNEAEEQEMSWSKLSLVALRATAEHGVGQSLCLHVDSDEAILQA